MKVNTFRDLQIWQKGIDLVIETYRLTRKFPPDELYGLTNQIRRATVSIPNNIAEGFGRNSRAELSYYLNIAKGSLFEIQTQAEIAYRLDYISESEYNSLNDKHRELEAMITAFSKRLSKNTTSSTNASK
jgi:four helix bundle protein